MGWAFLAKLCASLAGWAFVLAVADVGALRLRHGLTAAGLGYLGLALVIAAFAALLMRSMWGA